MIVYFWLTDSKGKIISQRHYTYNDMLETVKHKRVFYYVKLTQNEYIKHVLNNTPLKDKVRRVKK